MGLGSLIERGLIQQKLTRQERRSRFNEIDGRNLAKGGVCCTPFALLSTQVLHLIYYYALDFIIRFLFLTKDIDDNLSNVSGLNSSPKSLVIEELYIGTKNDSSSRKNASSKSRLIFPPIISRQRSSSSMASQTTAASTTTFDNDANTRFPVASRQTTFMKSISEIS